VLERSVLIRYWQAHTYKWQARVVFILNLDLEQVKHARMIEIDVTNDQLESVLGQPSLGFIQTFYDKE